MKINVKTTINRNNGINSLNFIKIKNEVDNLLPQLDQLVYELVN